MLFVAGAALSPVRPLVWTRGTVLRGTRKKPLPFKGGVGCMLVAFGKHQECVELSCNPPKGANLRHALLEQRAALNILDAAIWHKRRRRAVRDIHLSQMYVFAEHCNSADWCSRTVQQTLHSHHRASSTFCRFKMQAGVQLCAIVP